MLILFLVSADDAAFIAFLAVLPDIIGVFAVITAIITIIYRIIKHGLIQFYKNIALLFQKRHNKTRAFLYFRNTLTLMPFFLS